MFGLNLGNKKSNIDYGLGECIFYKGSKEVETREDK